MRFFELAQKLNLTHEKLQQFLSDETGDLSEEVDPFMRLSDEVVTKVISHFRESKKSKDNRIRISSVGISNFKAFGKDEQNIPLKPLTFIFGPNSAGKSSFLHSLLWAEDAFNTANLDIIRPRLSGDMVDLGGIRNIIHRKGADGTTFSLRFTFSPEQQTQSLIAALGQGKTLHLELTVDAGAISEKALMDRYVSSLTVDVSEDGILQETIKEGGRITRYALYLDNSDDPLLRLSKRMTGEFAVDNFLNNHSEFKKQWKTARESFSFSSKMSLGEMRAIQLLLDLSVQGITANGKKVLPDHAEFTGPPIQIDDVVSVLSNQPEPEEDIYGGVEDSYEAGDLAEAYAQYHEDDEGNPDPNDYDKPYTEDYETTDEVFDRVDWEYNRSRLKEIVDPVQLYAETTINTLVRESSSMVMSYLNSLIYLGSQRAYPDRGFTFTTKREVNWHANGGEAWDQLAKDSKLREKVNTWIQDQNHLKTPYKLAMRLFFDAENAYNPTFDSLEEDYEKATEDEVDLTNYVYHDDPENSKVDLLAWDSDKAAKNAIRSILSSKDVERFFDLYLIDTRSDTIVSHRDVGVGISQIIPILATAMSLKGKTVAIEEPESHLHPKAQAELADVFIESALSGENSNTFIIETHSETLLLRVLRRIRESSSRNSSTRPKVTENDVSFIYIDPTKTGSKITKVRIDKYGRILDNLPDGFFEEGFEELFS